MARTAPYGDGCFGCIDNRELYSQYSRADQNFLEDGIQLVELLIAMEFSDYSVLDAALHLQADDLSYCAAKNRAGSSFSIKQLTGFWDMHLYFSYDSLVLQERLEELG
ncbi:hypothetical protein [Microbulbifer sp. ZKSA002]|uniref:hypothetical protein n=1 Tax=Microbulbifer sp. ZKSA002 TaxID=3243388 RepID=UPI004039A51D